MASERKPSSWPVEVLLPALQALAEGAWLAVVYAALQALGKQPSWLGPIELGAVAWAGMAWGRRSRWRSGTAEALGLPLLALAAGAAGWLLDPGVRAQLAAGQPLNALGGHVAGWIVAAVAFWRGELHYRREDDADLGDRLLRWGVPALAIPLLVGQLATTSELEANFTAAAFLGTVVFVAAGFAVVGLARLEEGRVLGGSEWRGRRSWLVLVGGVALAVALLAIPAAVFLGLPGRSLLEAASGPLRTLILIFVLLAAPIFLAVSALLSIFHTVVPQGINVQTPEIFRILGGAHTDSLTGIALIVFWVLMAAIGSMILLILATLLWLHVDARRRAWRAVAEEPFEERSFERATVVPHETRPKGGRTRRGPAPLRGDDPTGAYLAALDALARDGRWARHPTETPAAHAARARGGGLAGGALGRLAAAYQLDRYAAASLSPLERGRSAGRLQALRRALGAGR